MSGEIAPLLDGIKVVADATTRDQVWPLATRPQNARVYRIDTGVVERWSGSAWVDVQQPALPGNSRTVATLSAYLANNAIFNVKDYGAKGDGVTPDTNAVAAAAAAAQAVAGELYFPAGGTYVMTAALAITNHCTIRGGPGAVLLFTGATDGITVTGSGGVFPRVSILGGLELRTSNASAGKALKYTSADFFECHGILVARTGSGRWTHGWWSDGVECASVTGLRIFNSATVAMRLQNYSNALHFFDLEVTGGNAGDATFLRGIEIDSTYDPGFHGATWQGYFAQSIAYITNGSGPAFVGVHFENTCATPSDGADVVVDGTSCLGGSFLCCKGASYLLGKGTTVVRKFEVIGGEQQAITLGLGSGSCLVTTRCASITDNGANNVILGCSDATGNPFANKVATHYIPPNVTNVPAGQSQNGIGHLLANGASVGWLDSGGAIRDLLNLTGSNQTFLRWIAATGLLKFANTNGTVLLTVSDAGVMIGTNGTTLTEIKKYAPPLTPSAVAANSISEQTFTVAGLVAGDHITVSPPAMTAGIGVLSARASAADTLAVTFVNMTAGSLMPTPGTYRITEVR